MGIQENSRDNVTCMIVLPSSLGCEESHATEFIPGPYNAQYDVSFQTAYEAMAAKAGKTLPEVLEMRYDQVMAELNAGLGCEHELKLELANIGMLVKGSR